MGYYIDLKSISIDRYREYLKNSHLIPGWMVLLENIDEYFAKIIAREIHNLEELKQVLKDKGKVLQFSEQSDIPENYLIVLRRVINGIHPKPNKISDFPAVSNELTLKLSEMGIKNTLKLYDWVLTHSDRSNFAEKVGTGQHEILKLTKLTDLSRIRWVNHTFAYVLYEVGYDTPGKVANANYKTLYQQVKDLNEERQIYKGHIGLNDMKICVEAAKEVPLEIEY